MSHPNVNTLVLNASYAVLGVVPWDVAVTALHNGKASVVEEYDQVVHSAYLTMRIPAVVRLNEFVKKPIKTVKFSRASVYSRDGYRCQYCGDHCNTNELTYDHVIPRAQGGETKWTNIVSCCYDCNCKKGNRTPEQAGMRLNKKPIQPSSVPKISFEFTGKSVPEQWRDYVYWNGGLGQD